MLADDHPVLRKGLADLLREQSHVVGEAQDGLEAMELFKTEPDVVLMDVTMPRLSGIEATRLMNRVFISLSSFLIAIKQYLANQSNFPCDLSRLS
jgi:YesN/AraC family two-component response regulator